MWDDRNDIARMLGLDNTMVTVTLVSNGDYPLETVEEMAKICLEAEKAEYKEIDSDFTGKTFARIDQSIAIGALFTASHLGAKAIVALTDSGSTPLVDESS